MRSTTTLAVGLAVASFALAGCPAPTPTSTGYVEYGGGSASCAGGNDTTDLLAQDANANPTLVLASNTLYWVDRSSSASDTIVALDLGGSAAPTTLFTAYPNPTASIEDVVSDGKNLYFAQTTEATDGSLSTELDSLPLAGGKLTKLTDNGSADFALAVADGYLYAFDYAGNTLRIPTAGGALEPFATADGALGLVGVGTDLFYVTGDNGLDKLTSADGKSQAIAASTGDGYAFSPSNPAPLAVNSESVFWPCGDDSGPLVCATKASGGATIALADYSSTGTIEIAADDVNLYYVDTGASCPAVTAVPVAGGTPTVLSSGFTPATALTMVHALATDGSYVYWVATGGQVLRASILGEGGGDYTVGSGSTEETGSTQGGQQG